MKKSVSILIIICSSIFQFSCHKDEWKKPTSISFKVDIDRTPQVGGNLTFQGGCIFMANFSFSGIREQGDDVYFNNPYSSGLNVTFDQNVVSPSLVFEVPQGTYTQITISFSTFGNINEDQIVVLGNYTNTIDGETYPLRLEIEYTESYNLVAQTTTGSQIVVLKKDVPSMSKIIFNPGYWFQPINAAMLDQAEVSDIEGIQTILISDDSNSDIYDLIRDRFNEGSCSSFEE